VAGPDLDVAIVGDGPAGLALAAACRRAGLATVVVGGGAPWQPTYGMWRDEVPDVPGPCFRHISGRVTVHGHRRHEIERAFAIVDNDGLRAHFACGVDVRVGKVERIEHFDWGSRLVTTTGDDVDARLAVDASGSRPAGAVQVAQVAFGIVVAELPPGIERDTVTLMDLRPPRGGGGGPPTFCYVVPVADGWLVEETVLAARPPPTPEQLRERLGVRLGPSGPQIIDGARRIERVVIPLDGRTPPRRPPVVRFGAAAGYIHPSTGFSVAAALRAAPRVAAAIAASAGRPDAVAAAVWPLSMRVTRRLHRYGLDVLLRLDAGQLAEFFDAFFELPVATWAPYLRLDASPAQVSRTMAVLLWRAPRSVRRQLAANPFAGR
jgi:lycopene beta-cyclase